MWSCSARFPMWESSCCKEVPTTGGHLEPMGDAMALGIHNIVEHSPTQASLLLPILPTLYTKSVCTSLFLICSGLFIKSCSASYSISESSGCRRVPTMAGKMEPMSDVMVPGIRSLCWAFPYIGEPPSIYLAYPVYKKKDGVLTYF